MLLIVVGQFGFGLVCDDRMCRRNYDTRTANYIESLSHGKSIFFAETLVAELPDNEEDVLEEPLRNRLERRQKATAVLRMEEGRPTYRPGAQEDGFLYVVGATVSVFLKEVQQCPECKAVLCRSPPVDSFVHERKYTDDSCLHFPSDALVNYISGVDAIIHRSCAACLHHRNIITTLHRQIATQVTTPSYLHCNIPAHSTMFESHFIKKWISVSLRIHLQQKSDKLMRQKLERRKRKKFLKLNIPEKRPRLIESAAAIT